MGVLTDGVRFQAEIMTVEGTTSATQQVILADIRGVKFPVAKFVESHKMYQSGLEKNYKPMVRLDNLAEHLAYLLNSYVKAELFSKYSYNPAMSAYKRFMVANLTYEAFENKIATALDTDGWE
jgi:hypothetical protein